MDIFRNKLSKHGRGFTLMELVVIIVVISILAAVVSPNLIAYAKEANEEKIMANLKTFHNGAETVDKTEKKLRINSEIEHYLSSNSSLLERVGEFANVPNERELNKYSIIKDVTGIITVKYRENDKIYTYPNFSVTEGHYKLDILLDKSNLILPEDMGPGDEAELELVYKNTGNLPGELEIDARITSIGDNSNYLKDEISLWHDNELLLNKEGKTVDKTVLANLNPNVESSVKLKLKLENVGNLNLKDLQSLDVNVTARLKAQKGRGKSDDVFTSISTKYGGFAHDINFNSNGGSSTDSQIVAHNDKVVTPTNPSKLGSTFVGWSPNIEAPITKDTTFNSIWTKNNYVIAFNTDGGNTIESITQEYGTDIVQPANPVKDKYDFVKWDKAIPKTMPAENVTIKAEWKSNTRSKTITLPRSTDVEQTHNVPLDNLRKIRSIKVIGNPGATVEVVNKNNSSATVKVNNGSGVTELFSGTTTPRETRNISDTKTTYGSNTTPASIDYNLDGFSGTMTKDNTTSNTVQTGGSYTASDSKTVYDSSTSYGNNSTPSSISYNSGGYSGTLSRTGTTSSTVQTGGSYSSGDNKTVYDSRTSYYNNNNPSSIYYDSGGYSGTLYKSGSTSSSLISGSAGGSTSASTTDYSVRISRARWNGSSWGLLDVIWDPNKPNDPPQSIYVENGEYSGYIPHDGRKIEYSDSRPYGTLPTGGGGAAFYHMNANGTYKAGSYTGQIVNYRTVHTRWYYQGTIYKPDTRQYSYTQSYSGTVYYPGYDTRTYRTDYTSSYSGTVTKPAVDTRTYRTDYTANYSGVAVKPATDTRVYKTYYGYTVEIEYEVD